MNILKRAIYLERERQNIFFKTPESVNEKVTLLWCCAEVDKWVNLPSQVTSFNSLRNALMSTYQRPCCSNALTNPMRLFNAS